MHCFNLLKVFVKRLFFTLKIICNFVGFTIDIDLNVSLIKKNQYGPILQRFCLERKVEVLFEKNKGNKKIGLKQPSFIE